MGVCITENNIAKCNCNEGYKAEGLTCIDINECDLNIDNCEESFECENTIGSFKCNEININLCENVTCNEWQSCNSSNGVCELNEGRCILNSDCRDNKECDINHNCVNTSNPCEGQSCSNLGECVIENNIAKCNCNEGYIANGLNCEMSSFVTTWKTDNTAFESTSETQAKISVSPRYTYNYNIDCNNDGVFEAVNLTDEYICNYETPGIYQIAITGDFPSLYINYTQDRLKLISVDNWGSIKWKSMESSFEGCENLIINAIDNPDLSEVTDMSYMFLNATSLNSNLNNWDVSNVTNMSYMFYNAISFNSDLSRWNVSNVTDMSYMFANAIAFNGNLSNWNVLNVTNMKDMFNNATSFNSDLSNWNVSNVRNMSYMFAKTSAFNSDLSNWNVSNITDMRNMFYFAVSFNQPLNNWNVSKVTNMKEMFYFAIKFNQDLSNWDVDQVTSCESIYIGTQAWILPKPNFTSCNPN